MAATTPTAEEIAAAELAKTQTSKPQKAADAPYECGLGTFVGEDASRQVRMADLKMAVGGVELNAALGDAEEFKKRQHLLDPNKYSLEFKKPNPGKPPNNQDAFPVDLKIEEFETHSPDVYVEEATASNHSSDLLEKFLISADAAEKRIIKLENNMATVLRYLFRLGSRVSINCVYWGGISPFQKYKAIRCLCDDRVGEGQEVQIDQCMNCTRFEPVYGQCYEILNDIGANVATILDDNQMSYGNMEKYIAENRIEEFHKEPDAGVILVGLTQKRDSWEKDFVTRWGKGIAMNWKYVPKDQQKVHVNWRQSINDDGSQLKRLSSYPNSPNNVGVPMTSSKPAVLNDYQKNKQAMDNYKPPTTSSSSSSSSSSSDDSASASSGAKIKAAIDKGKQVGGTFDNDETGNRFRCGWTDELRKQTQGYPNVDPLEIAAICLASNGQANGAIIAKKLSEISSVTGTQSKMLNLLAYKIGAEKVAAYVRGVPINASSAQEATVSAGAKDLWTEFIQNFLPKSSSSFGSSSQTSAPVYPYGQVSEDDLAFVPSIVYTYCIIQKFCKTSTYDGDWAGFPFTQEQIDTGDLYFTSKFGDRPSTDSFHHGIDISGSRGIEIHAIADGTVTQSEGWTPWNAVIIDHGNGIFSKYLHCSSVSVTDGQTVTKGQVIGTIGGYGPAGPDNYPDHLHLEIGSEQFTSSNTNPIDYYPLLNGCEPDRGGHYYDLKNRVLT